ncbi:hypothetical protein M011DRAFT_466272 [Sporormia fimetaria CBS 119925]|uniref:Uncharacterized protein n=1 Tax=Sporormia fimetaria CBS 119925 TaxID=1340428 RepID=A0A6A6VEY7_9PLEO|nr:hypothetical protein M011DRAFT_466272 [Sporormia fimetaria CBS 119925]
MESDAASEAGAKPSEVDMSDDALSDSGYFGAPSPIHTLEFWLPPSPSPSPDLVLASSRASLRRNAAARSRKTSPPGPTNTTTQHPYTPTKTAIRSGAPQYPFTPDSTRKPALRRAASATLPPPGPAPWDASPTRDRASESPVQRQLHSTFTTLENIISATPPTDEQMEFVLGQLESITTTLLPRGDESLQTDAQLSIEQGQSDMASQDPVLSREEAERYISEVEIFVTKVKKHAEDYKLRLEEAKKLHALSEGIIANLQQEKQLHQEIIESLKQELREARTPRRGKHHKIYVKVEKPSGIWAAFREALDEAGKLMYVW